MIRPMIAESVSRTRRKPCTPFSIPSGTRFCVCLSIRLTSSGTHPGTYCRTERYGSFYLFGSTRLQTTFPTTIDARQRTIISAPDLFLVRIDLNASDDAPKGKQLYLPNLSQRQMRNATTIGPQGLRSAASICSGCQARRNGPISKRSPLW